MTECEFCGYHASCNTINIDDAPHFLPSDNIVEGVAHPGDFTRETYQICMQCFQRLHNQDHDFLRTIREMKCELCHRRYAGIRARFSYGGHDVRTVRCCSRCLPMLRNSAERLSDTIMHFNNQVTPSNEWDEVIEFKDRVCYIWSPLTVEIKRARVVHVIEDREDHRTKVSVTIDQRSRDTSFMRAQEVQRALIYDGDIIWILDKPHITTINILSRLGPDEFRGASYHERRKVEIEFICGKIETRSVDSERARQVERGWNVVFNGHIDVRNTLSTAGRDAVHNELYTTPVTNPNDDFRAFHDAIDAYALITPQGNHDFSQPYDDPAGRILVYCSCGFEKKISPSQNTVTHAGVTATVQSVLYNPGSHTTTQLGSHIVTMRSPSRRDPLQ